VEDVVMSSASSVPAIEIRGLGFVHDDGRRALEEVAFSVRAGESLGVVGPNGAGKTTLFMTLLGIHRPAEGEIYLFGTRFPSENGAHVPPELRRRIGLVFQESDEQLFSPTVFDDVAFAPLNFGFPKGEIRARVERALAAVDLAGYGERAPHHLSAGEKRRVAIATVISYEPDVLILDEPTGDLDPRGRRHLVELLGRMPQTKIIASHDLGFVRDTCERVVLLDGGRIRADGPAGEVLGDRELLERHGL
jgi:cobalt/nickel transport system ATP-binding protein